MIGVLVATGALAGKVLSERFWLQISCSMGEMVGCCCGAAAVLVAAVALSYFFKKMKMQAAATCAGAMHVSEFTSSLAAHALVGMHSKTIRHAAAAMSAAKGDRYVLESLFAIVDNCHVFVSRSTILGLESCWVLWFPGFATLDLLQKKNYGLFPVSARNKAVL